MEHRLDVIIAESNPRQEILFEIAIIYSNVASIFVYLEGNETHLDYGSLLRHRDKFFKNPGLYASILWFMSRLNCPDPEAERVRQIWMAWFQERAQAKDQDMDEKLEQARQSAKHVLYRAQADQAKLLERLGVNTGTVNPSTVFYRIVSDANKLETRRKLAQAWKKQRDLRTDELVDILDRVVEVRRLQAKENGFNTVLEQTFEQCSVSESKAHALITAYLTRALESHSQLALNISNVTGCIDNPMDHFGYFVRLGLTGSNLPMLPLDGCLDFLFTIMECIFDIKVTRIGRENLYAVNVAIWSGDQRLGTIGFDLLDTRRRHFSDDDILGIRDQSNLIDIALNPIYHVLCRFQRGSDGSRLITFESAHSIFHEFGHALNHLLLRQRLPSESGLDYLPVERLEDLSTWFEKWVFHPDFATHLSLSCQYKVGLAQCQRVKMLEYHRTNLERAVTAALDFDVHRRPEGGLRESFEEIDKQFAISDHCSFGDLLGHFTKPMFWANSGAGFVYLWGAAYGAQNFAPFSNLRLGDIQMCEQVGNRFNSCFDPSEPSTEPSVEAVFDFYNVVL
jgi:oligopeptidase A